LVSIVCHQSQKRQGNATIFGTVKFKDSETHFKIQDFAEYDKLNFELVDGNLVVKNVEIHFPIEKRPGTCCSIEVNDVN